MSRFPRCIRAFPTFHSGSNMQDACVEIFHLAKSALVCCQAAALGGRELAKKNPKIQPKGRRKSRICCRIEVSAGDVGVSCGCEPLGCRGGRGSSRLCLEKEPRGRAPERRSRERCRDSCGDSSLPSPALLGRWAALLDPAASGEAADVPCSAWEGRSTQNHARMRRKLLELGCARGSPAPPLPPLEPAALPRLPLGFVIFGFFFFLSFPPPPSFAGSVVQAPDKRWLCPGNSPLTRWIGLARASAPRNCPVGPSPRIHRHRFWFPFLVFWFFYFSFEIFLSSSFCTQLGSHLLVCVQQDKNSLRVNEENYLGKKKPHKIWAE